MIFPMVGLLPMLLSSLLLNVVNWPFYVDIIRRIVDIVFVGFFLFVLCTTVCQLYVEFYCALCLVKRTLHWTHVGSAAEAG